jgi:hypothetical protein
MPLQYHPLNHSRGALTPSRGFSTGRPATMGDGGFAEGMAPRVGPGPDAGAGHTMAPFAEGVEGIDPAVFGEHPRQTPNGPHWFIARSAMRRLNFIIDRMAMDLADAAERAGDLGRVTHDDMLRLGWSREQIDLAGASAALMLPGILASRRRMRIETRNAMATGLALATLTLSSFAALAFAAGVASLI